MIDLKVVHNSTQEEFRSPLGSIGTRQHIRLKLQCAEHFQNIHLVLYETHSRHEYQMYMSEGFWFVDVLTPDYPVVMWYYFCLFDGENHYYYCPRYANGIGVGEIYSHPSWGYQITVTEEGFKTPDDFKKGVMYQIFPDRFCKSEGAKPQEGIKYHTDKGRKAIFHGSFDGSPMFRPLPGEEHYSPCDYFGGDLKGIEESLPYLSGLGVTILYLNPIFEADSNHRYNTADYKKIDPILGTEKDFKSLCTAAKNIGMKVILDGVFSHTGSDSVYFNKDDNYKQKGAYQSKKSKYYNWYSFQNWPDEYTSWWGFNTLPEVNEQNDEWQDFVITGEDNVLEYWMNRGAAGYRLDVADELPDNVIELIRTTVKKQNGFLLGEVWEDPTVKESYGNLRTYALGRALDSVMNYPLRNALVGFLNFTTGALQLKDFLLGQSQNYPKEMYYCLMNLLSSHDIERIRTVLATRMDARALDREQQFSLVILKDQDKRGATMQRLAVLLLFTIPGMPSIYYGDETGMHGLKDPFNRAPFAMIDSMMENFYAQMVKLRRTYDALTTGHMCVFNEGEDIIGVIRVITDSKDAFGNEAEDGLFVSVINRSAEKKSFVIDFFAEKDGLPLNVRQSIRELDVKRAICLLTGTTSEVRSGLIEVEIQPFEGMLFKLT